ncbi:hypothetical protein V7S43_004789 [Phytophthora oleae]|uniref:Membrane transporter protein n=1 Tax=Phytophthora oleae TaxID=2107226 RepID=A0ABD3FU66_9STRA
MQQLGMRFTLLVLAIASTHATLRNEPEVPSADEAVLPQLDKSFAQREVFGMTLAGLVIFVAAGGGTGGGGVLDPIYILVMGLSAKTAIPLSSITILGGAFGKFPKSAAHPG